MSTFKTLLTGIAVGTVLGILYAPAKGIDTRRKLARRGDELKDKFNELKESINDKLDSLKSDVNEMTYIELERIEREASSAQHNAWQS